LECFGQNNSNINNLSSGLGVLRSSEMLKKIIQKQDIVRHDEVPQDEATRGSQSKIDIELDGRTPYRGFAMTDFLGLPLILIPS
jgi:hypothetical protein